VRQNEGQENGYGRYCNHSMRRTLPRTPRDVAVLFSARYLTVLTGGLRLSHVWGNVVGLAEPLPRTVRIWAALHSPDWVQVFTRRAGTRYRKRLARHRGPTTRKPDRTRIRKIVYLFWALLIHTISCKIK